MFTRGLSFLAVEDECTRVCMVHKYAWVHRRRTKARRTACSRHGKGFLGSGALSGAALEPHPFDLIREERQGIMTHGVMTMQAQGLWRSKCLVSLT